MNAAMASMIALEGITCAKCSAAIEVPDVPDNAVVSPYAYYSECRQVYCGSCALSNKYQMALGCSCSGRASCLLQPLSPTMVQRCTMVDV